jgi:hypothetical protein
MSGSLSKEERLEAEEILNLALNAPSSGRFVAKAQLGFSKAGASSFGRRALKAKKVGQKNSSTRGRCR